MFTYSGERFCSKKISFSAPKGFKLLFPLETHRSRVSLMSSDTNTVIEVFYGKETTEPEEEILRFCRQKDFVAVSDVFKVKRGNGEGDALFFDLSDGTCSFYCECYALKPKLYFYSFVQIILWTYIRGEAAHSAKTVLKQPEVKDFFDSIELT